MKNPVDFNSRRRKEMQKITLQTFHVLFFVFLVKLGEEKYFCLVQVILFTAILSIYTHLVKGENLVFGHMELKV